MTGRVWWWARRAAAAIAQSGMVAAAAAVAERFLPAADRRWRRALVAADVAIFRNQDVDEAAGVDDETDEYVRLHDEWGALADGAPWWVRAGTWSAAVRRHERDAGGPR